MDRSASAAVPFEAVPPATDADASKRDARFVAVVLVGGAVVAAALWSGSSQLGPLPAEQDPTYVALATVDAAATPDEALARSLELERSGDLEAAAREAEAAVRLGGGRDAAMQAAKIAILQHRHDRAERLLRPLVEHGRDAAAMYNLALVQHRRGDLEAAGRGYQEVLRVDPHHADARYNLAYSYWERGDADAARQQAERFASTFPDDPRGAQLRDLVRRPK